MFKGLGDNGEDLMGYVHSGKLVTLGPHWRRFIEADVKFFQVSRFLFQGSFAFDSDCMQTQYVLLICYSSDKRNDTMHTLSPPSDLSVCLPVCLSFCFADRYLCDLSVTPGIVQEKNPLRPLPR